MRDESAESLAPTPRRRQTGEDFVTQFSLQKPVLMCSRPPIIVDRQPLVGPRRTCLVAHGIFAASSIEFVTPNGSRNRKYEINAQTRSRFHVARADDGARSRGRARRGRRAAAP